MGFFSFYTQDTNRSISNRHSDRGSFTVYMKDRQDPPNIYREDNYEGYGIFGGKDIHELIAEMNGLKTRDEGIKIYFDEDKEDIILPILSEDPDFVTDECLENCPEQGYFYEEKCVEILGGMDMMKKLEIHNQAMKNLGFENLTEITPEISDQIKAELDKLVAPEDRWY